MGDPLHAMYDPLARLIHDAGRREEPPARAYEVALRAATEVWEAKVRRRRWRWIGALAACLAALSVGTAILLNSFDSPPLTSAPVARIARVIGDVRVKSGSSREWTSLREEHVALHTDETLRTERGSAVALQLEDVSVRIGENAEVMLESASRLRLMSGKVYVDTGSQRRVGRMLVITDAASASDVGTQFEVLYQDGRYRLRVREGYVLLQRGQRQQRGGAGEQISIDRDDAVSIASIAVDDPEWRWAQSLAPAPEIDNQPLTVLLAWVARETGLAVRYATPAIERKATATILHGSIRNLEPLQALVVMLATTDLHHEVLADGTIMIK